MIFTSRTTVILVCRFNTVGGQKEVLKTIEIYVSNNNEIFEIVYKKLNSLKCHIMIEIFIY